MEMTTPTEGVHVARGGLHAALRKELDQATQQARRAPAGDVTATLAALDRLKDLIDAINEVRWPAGTESRELIKQALRAGVDERDLYGRPFSPKIVLALKKELNLPPAKRGPRPRRQPGTGASE